MNWTRHRQSQQFYHQMDRLVALIRKLWGPIATPAGFILAAIVTHLWRRFRSRLMVLRWSAQHTNVALAAAHPVFGKDIVAAFLSGHIRPDA